MLTEIWNCRDFDISGYKSFVQGPILNQSRKGGRYSGGIALLYKSNLQKTIFIVKTNQNFLWFKIDKKILEFVKGFLRLRGLYPSM